MTWKHLNETLRDPGVWRDIYKDLLKDGIKYVLKGVFWLTVGFWVGSKLDPRIALAWGKATGAFGPAWQALWRPVDVPRIIVVTAFVLAMLVPTLRWWGARRLRKKAPLVPDVVVPLAESEPATAKPVTLDDLNENQRRVLSVLIRLYPMASALSHLAEVFQVQYSVVERVCESLEKVELVSIFLTLSTAKSVRLTAVGRDFCQDNGLAVDN